jgi:hypothetical protein
VRRGISCKKRIGKEYSLEYTELLKVLFAVHHGRRRQKANKGIVNATMLLKAKMVSNLIWQPCDSKPMK